MDFSSLNGADCAIIAIIGFSVLISLMRGFVREALSLTSWIVACWVSITFSSILAELLKTYIKDQYLAIGVAFFLLFATTLIIGTLISYLIAQVVQVTGLRGTDRLLGVLFGFGRGVLLVAVLILFAGMTHFTQQPWWTSSVLIPQFKPLALWLVGFLPKELPLHL